MENSHTVYATMVTFKCRQQLTEPTAITSHTVTINTSLAKPKKILLENEAALCIHEKWL